MIELQFFALQFRAFVYEGFLTDEECNHLISLVSFGLIGKIFFIYIFKVFIWIGWLNVGEIRAEEVSSGGQCVWKE